MTSGGSAPSTGARNAVLTHRPVPGSRASVTQNEESRKFPRTELDVRARLSLRNQPDRFFEATLPISNLSVGGLFLKSTFFLKIGTELEVTLVLPKQQRVVKAFATVVRVETWSDSADSESGFALRFTEFLDGSQVVLATLFLGPMLRDFIGEYAKQNRISTSGDYLDRTADVLCAWEIRKAELGADVWGLMGPPTPQPVTKSAPQPVKQTQMTYAHTR